MSKRFRGTTCVYCGKESAAKTADHVLARQFVSPAHRANLPKVPACATCNNGKSKHEHYLTAVLPFGGRHPDSAEILKTEVPRRLARNGKLHKALSRDGGRSWVREAGGMRLAMTIPIEAAHLRGYFRYVVRGLAYHHWATVIPPSYYVGAGLLTVEGEALVRPLLMGRSAARIEQSLGNGVFEYIGSQALDDPNLSIWQFRVYGGVQLGGDPAASNEVPSTIWAASAPESLDEIFGDDE